MDDRPQKSGHARAVQFRQELGPLVVAMEATLVPKIFTDEQEAGHQIIFVNDAFLNLTGFTRAEILGEPLCKMLSDVADSQPPKSIRHLIANGGFGIWKLKCRRDDKREVLAAVEVHPVRNQNNILRQNFISFVEIGGPIERLAELNGHVDQALNDQDQMAALYDSAPGFIAVTKGADHRFIYANTSYKRFVGKDDVEGMTVAETLPEVIDQGFVNLLDQVYNTGRAFVGKSMPIGIINPVSGKIETHYRDFVYQPIRDNKNVVTGVFLEGYDVTGQREIADKLSALQTEMIFVSRVNAVGTMASTLAHELKQPLSAISNYTTGIKRMSDPAAPNSERVMGALEGIEQAAQNATETIRNLRDLTKRHKPDRINFDLKSAVDECVRLMEATAPLEVRFLDDIPSDLTMTADRIQIQQVILNLLRNACEAVLNSEDQIISIKADKLDTNLLVSVRDTGPGISADDEEAIFQWSISSKSTGMGLGLSICRTIIEAHRGRIWLENSSEQGSEFCFSIPLPATCTSTYDNEA